ncbi:MAG: pyrroloquinoline quinone biosynthesis protein PqqE [Magnetospiraceae bacterium]
MSPHPQPPLATLLELTHRCPLRCAYCSNPLELERAAAELDTETWKRVIGEAAAMGILQVHFSGGEPTVRKDLEALVSHAVGGGLYTNLITSGVLMGEDRVRALADRGLAHVQVGFQDAESAGGDWVAGRDGSHQKKLEVARMVVDAGMALTVNAVVHRHNIKNLPQLVEMAEDLGAHRIEIANVQYYGWGLKNRAALMPSKTQLAAMTPLVEEMRAQYHGRLLIDYVIPDYYATHPKSCLGGWGRRFLTIAPNGRVMPCHAASTIPGLEFDTVRDRGLSDIWQNSTAFEAFRAPQWVPEGCEGCDRREIDFGGCRCQALALTGDAANMDPTCIYSPFHDQVVQMAEEEAARGVDQFIHRSFTL